jgi:hypothetical protein
MKTLLPKKAEKSILVTNDDSYTKLAEDPTIAEINPGTTYDSYTVSNVNTNVATSNNTWRNEMQPSTHVVRTTAGDNAGQNAESLVKADESWVNKRWRPAMGWMYMAVCVFDFILFPILYSIVQFWETQDANDAFRQWDPLTLQGAGLFHMAMGAVLGIAVYGRTKEKVEGRN